MKLNYEKISYQYVGIGEKQPLRQHYGLRVLPNLERISLINIVNAEIAIRQMCRCNKELKMITIKNCKYTNHTEGKFPERVLRNVVICCKKLEKINLKGTPFKGRHFYMDAAALSNLRSINLGNNPFLRTKNLYELILNCHNLEELKLSYRSAEQQLSDADVVCLFAKLRPTLKSVTFDMADLSDTSLAAILACTKLEKLNLYNTSNLSSELFVTLWRLLRHLKILKIQNAMISNEHFVRLFTDGSSSLCNLKLLNLSGSKLNSNTLETISECCRNLQKIVLKCCKNLETLENFLENCPHITSINVAFCDKISDNELLKIPEKLSNLRTLYLDFHRRNVLENIKNTCTHLDIFICLSEFSKNVEKLE
ncbi:hypothetical protein CBL_03286 [Carabus blaptoides fortunei]